MNANYCTKQRHKDHVFLGENRWHNRIASISYVEKKMETVNHIVSELSKLATTEWIRFSTENCGKDWNLTMLPNGICPNQNPHTILWYLEIQTHHLIPTWRPDLISSSSWRAIGTDIPDHLSPPLLIVHCFRQVFSATHRIYTELLHVGSSWSPCLCSSTGVLNRPYFSSSVPHVWFV